ncbi:MAG: hypothetical protein L6Q97_05335, partial [Thermoanaerobaculia bacterium]|nr:hypothetical protein [Thermoanaerobaculia bacterium]
MRFHTENLATPGIYTFLHSKLPAPIFVLWLLILRLEAQPSSAVALESTLYHNTLWRHTPKLTIQTGQPVFGQEWGLRLQTRGSHSWHHWQRYPAFGLVVAHFRLGERAHGDAWGLLPNLAIPVLRAG